MALNPIVTFALFTAKQITGFFIKETFNKERSENNVSVGCSHASYV